MKAMNIGVSGKLRSLDPIGENKKSKQFNERLVAEFVAEVATKIPDLNNPDKLRAIKQAACSHIRDVRTKKGIGPQLKKDPFLQTYQDYFQRLDEIFIPYHAKIQLIPKRKTSDPSFTSAKQEPFIRYTELKAEIKTSLSELEAKLHAAVYTRTMTLSEHEIKGALLTVKAHTYWYLKGYKQINLDKTLFTTPNLISAYDFLNKLSLPIMEKLERMAKTNALTSCVANKQNDIAETKPASFGKQATSPTGHSVFGGNIKDRIAALQLKEEIATNRATDTYSFGL